MTQKSYSWAYTLRKPDLKETHVPHMFISYCSWGSQGNTEVVCICIPFSSGPHFVRTLHHDSLSWVALHGMAHSFTTRLWPKWSVWLVFCDCGFHSACPLMEKDTRLVEAYWWEGLAVGESGSCSDGWGHAQ